MVLNMYDGAYTSKHVHKLNGGHIHKPNCGRKYMQKDIQRNLGGVNKHSFENMAMDALRNNAMIQKLNCG